MLNKNSIFHILVNLFAVQDPNFLTTLVVMCLKFKKKKTKKFTKRWQAHLCLGRWLLLFLYSHMSFLIDVKKRNVNQSFVKLFGMKLYDNW